MWPSGASGNTCLTVNLQNRVWYILFCFRIVESKFQCKYNWAIASKREPTSFTGSSLYSFTEFFLQKDFFFPIVARIICLPSFTICFLHFFKVSFCWMMVNSVITMSCKQHFLFLHQNRDWIWNGTNSLLVNKYLFLFS